MKHKYIKITIIISLLLQINSLAQDKLRFDHLTSEEGLSQSTIFEIMQDKEGYIWFATYNGLNKYDGYTFTVYISNNNDTYSISSNAVTSLLEDDEGFIWAGTFEGN